MSANNVKTIQDIYAAFGKGDVPAILSRVTPDTTWDFNGGRPEVPWHERVAGKEALPRFFQAMGENMELRAFEPREFIASGPHVMVDVHIEYTVKKTGKRVAMDQIHWWTLDEQNRVRRLRHYEDTAQVLMAVS